MTKYYFMFHGLPASGKSTLAQQLAKLLESRGMEYVQVNRDDMRAKYFGESYNLNPPIYRNESFISEKMNEAIQQAYADEVNIIDDNTNLVTKDIRQLRKTLPKDMQLVHILFDLPLETVKARNISRTASGGRNIPESAIERMHRQSYNHDGSKIDRYRLIEGEEPVMETVSPEELDRMLGVAP